LEKKKTTASARGEKVRITSEGKGGSFYGSWPGKGGPVFGVGKERRFEEKEKMPEEGEKKNFPHGEGEDGFSEKGGMPSYNLIEE